MEIFAEPWLMPALEGFGLGGSSVEVPEEDETACLSHMVSGEKPPISSGFGDSEGRTSPHKGVDMAVPTGIQVFALMSGVVDRLITQEEPVPPGERSTPDSTSTGNYVQISYSNGDVGRYLHLKTNSVTLEKGAQVAAGQYIGQSNATGEGITGAHLHYDHKKSGQGYVDPEEELDC